MLEMLALRWITGTISSILEAKNQPTGRYKLLAVLLWLVGEIVGMLAGLMLTGDIGLGAYVLALIGALAGAWIAITIAHRLPVWISTDGQQYAGR